jgi:hypothetical protein
MNNALIYFNTLLFSVWTFFGLVAYSQYHDEIPNRKKKWLFRAVCGPIIWILVAVSCIFDILGFLDGIFTTFIGWLRKP